VGTQLIVAPPQHFLYFFPDLHGHRSFRPTLEPLRLGSTPKPPTASLPPLPLRLLPGGANQFPGGSCSR